ncbi:hypothetical protein IWQ60_002892 [Tieghemiomyces parasiticus]|uniref:HSF-type DNA-binding domain-containing protein n=1 Tax=Tieghemiomyces parasiticus TaxID=78921 RepID=A0A9W8ABU5_9FUNG|nr:hypothetical protein IWQ60_002892 [Tieghemiomyces parasiticus]
MKSVPPFVVKLYKMLDCGDHYPLITWDNLGDVISVRNPTQFQEQVLPLYYKTGDFRSFTRQLHIYGFERLSDARKSRRGGSDQLCRFRHPSFLRGRHDLLLEVKRIPLKSVAEKTTVRTSPHKPYPAYADHESRRAMAYANTFPPMSMINHNPYASAAYPGTTMSDLIPNSHVSLNYSPYLTHPLNSDPLSTEAPLFSFAGYPMNHNAGSFAGNHNYVPMPSRSGVGSKALGWISSNVHTPEPPSQRTSPRLSYSPEYTLKSAPAELPWPAFDTASFTPTPESTSSPEFQLPLASATTGSMAVMASTPALEAAWMAASMAPVSPPESLAAVPLTSEFAVSAAMLATPGPEEYHQYSVYSHLSPEQTRASQSYLSTLAQV